MREVDKALDRASPGDSQWELVGSDIYFDLGLVGIGETSPIAPLHVRANDLSVSELENFEGELVIEASDAGISLFSNGSGGFGSSVTLSEMTGGALLDAWTAARRTGQGGSELWLTYGSDPDFSLPEAFSGSTELARSFRYTSAATP